MVTAIHLTEKDIARILCDYVREKHGHHYALCVGFQNVDGTHAEIRGAQIVITPPKSV